MKTLITVTVALMFGAGAALAQVNGGDSGMARSGSNATGPAKNNSADQSRGGSQSGAQYNSSSTPR